MTDEINKRPVGRPAYEPNPSDEGKIHFALTYGLSQEEIESYMGRDIDTLKKHYAELFATVKADRNGAVKRALAYQATVLNLPASTIFWLKTQDPSFREQKEDTAKDNAQEFLGALSKALNANKTTE
jgi:hypothetical protein